LLLLTDGKEAPESSLMVEIDAQAPAAKTPLTLTSESQTQDRCSAAEQGGQTDSF